MKINSLISQEGRGQARLKGVVLDDDGNPIEGVKIELESLVHKLSMTTETNKKGIWSFIGLGRTVVKITASKEGYDPTTIPKLDVSAIKNLEQEIVLQKITDIERLEEEDPRTLYLKGDKLYNQGEYEKALVVFKEFVETQPKLYEARVNIGNCYIRLRQYDKAMEEFRFVLEKLKVEKGEEIKLLHQYMPVLVNYIWIKMILRKQKIILKNQLILIPQIMLYHIMLRKFFLAQIKLMKRFIIMN